ncbi:PQQ-binding-like beta-propeller repeat protein [Streptomyces sp. ITFR-6]|uniref:outer membrane protein assembly factor BamB family protein n=1 Tax=Streptomyces sp. ITFR-6 TaxID=3075197 RepID=UPI00288BE52C|nr:PQQ-binding-like beta-propeller repeat protein [Streptomyces sp. ITFR-6]WNI29257.1 PQQ-binding-like beta-propeller repeat protein [Streptomyces sp. ITFR-6]
MEALRQDDPRRFGPYTALVRLRETAAAVQYLARGATPQDLAVITAARPELAALPGFRRHFEAEARTADRLAGGWVAAQLGTGTDGAEEDEPLWAAAEYVPALTLAEAIETAGPLPERAVRILGAGIAETLSRVHATGAVLQGLAPRTVLLAGDGPRLTAFGPLGAAADAEARPGGQLSVRLGYLTPEQIEGEEAGPASDLFVLGLLLAYAATGSTPLADGPATEAAERIAHTDPELASVPDALRDLIGRCLAKDPADRPTAGAVAAELALEGAAGLAKGGDWLPAPLAAAVAEQGMRAQALETAPPVIEDAVPVTDTAETADATGATGAVGATGAPEGPDVPGATGAPDADAPEVPDVQDAVPLALPAGDGSGEPAAGRDTRTAQFGIIDPRAPRSDLATTQLVLNPEVTGPAGPPAGQAPQSPQAPQPLPYTAPAAPFLHTGHPVPHPAAQGPAPLPAPFPLAAAPERPSAGRRSLLIGAAAGVAGLLVGGGAVFALDSGDDDEPTDDAKPAPSTSRAAVAGLPPQPRWIHTHPESEPAPRTAALWNDRLLVLTDADHATAIDLRTGDRVWQNADAAKGQAALPAGKELCFVAAPDEFLWLSAKDGKVAHRLAYADGFDGAPHLVVPDLVGASGSTVWFTGSTKSTVKAPKPKKGKKRGKDKVVVKSYLFGYDIEQRKELWRTPVPTGRGPEAPEYRLIAVRPDDIVVRQSQQSLTAADVKAAKGKGKFRSFDRKTGKAKWTEAFGTVTPGGAAVGDADGLLYAAVGDDLRAFGTPDGKPRWTLNGTRGSHFGNSVEAGELLHTTNSNQEVGAVDRATGRPRWQRSTEGPRTDVTPVISVSSTGGTLLAASSGQVTAFAAADGRRLWKFQDIGEQDPKGATVTSTYQVLPFGKSALVRRGRMVYAFPVD